MHRPRGPKGPGNRARCPVRGDKSKGGRESGEGCSPGERPNGIGNRAGGLGREKEDPLRGPQKKCKFTDRSQCTSMTSAYIATQE